MLAAKLAKRNYQALDWALWLSAWLGMLLILGLPLVGLVQVLTEGFSFNAWKLLRADPQVLPALKLSIFSASISTLTALVLACSTVFLFYPSKTWQRLQQQLPIFLAIPHAAFALGLVMLAAPSGWFARWLAAAFSWTTPPHWTTTQDPYALSLTLALTLKETWFLLWVLTSLLNQQSLRKQSLIAQSMGYGRWQLGWQILFPQLLKPLAWPLLAVFAYGLSVVDMALILGPSTPPTSAVLAWQSLADPDPQQALKAQALIWLLMALLVLGAGLAYLSYLLLRSLLAHPQGQRHPQYSVLVLKFILKPLLTLPFWLALSLLVLGSVAESWFFPQVLPAQLSLKAWQQANFSPLGVTLFIACCSVAIALPLSLIWLEWGKQQAWLYLPLIIPALPFTAAQYQVALILNLDGSLFAVIWSHLAWVLPYMLLTLTGAYRQFDERYLLTAKTLGYPHWQSCLMIKWRLLLGPILAACAVGFAVSVAQYLPTVFVGGGRIETVTTEAVSLSSSGNRSTLAVQAVLQALLPLIAFASVSYINRLYAQQRPGLS